MDQLDIMVFLWCHTIRCNGVNMEWTTVAAYQDAARSNASPSFLWGRRQRSLGGRFGKQIFVLGIALPLVTTTIISGMHTSFATGSGGGFGFAVLLLW